MIPLRFAVLVIALAAAISSTDATSQVLDATLSVNDPRPLNEAVKLIEERCGCPITYEDTAFTKADVEDVSNDYPDRRVPAVFSPRGGVFIFTTRLARGDHDPTHVLAALRDLADTYNLTGYPGRFHVDHTGVVFHVEPEHSVLDTPVTAHFDRVSADAATRAVLASISHAGPHIDAGTMSVTNLFLGTLVNINAVNRPAREVLVRILAQAPFPASRRENGRFIDDRKPLSWRLLRDANTSEYVLNIAPIP